MLGIKHLIIKIDKMNYYDYSSTVYFGGGGGNPMCVVNIHLRFLPMFSFTS